MAALRACAYLSLWATFVLAEEVDDALADDDQCQGDEQCSFNAVQLRGQKVPDAEEEPEVNETELGASMDDCLQHGVYYTERWGGHHMAGTQRTKVSDADICQAKCAAHPGCGHFSFWSDGGCLLTSDSAFAKSHHGVIAGPATCQTITPSNAISKPEPSPGAPSTSGSHAERALEAQGMLGYAMREHYHVYNPTVSSLKLPSQAPLQTFYIYRATSGKKFPMENVNAANAEGVMWYLHNEIVRYVPRRFAIDRIIRFKVQYRAPTPLHDKGMNFGVRYAFDSGKCTGPGDCSKELGKYGNFVGCNLVYQYPTPQFEDGKYYGSPAWYSFPGDCSSKDYMHQDNMCKTYQPGGACKGTPTGAGDCTYSYEPAGFVMLDDVVGIKDYTSFARAGGREYVAGFGVSQSICRRYRSTCDKGIHLDFWDWKHSEKYNKLRVQKMKDEFKKKYPGEEELGDAPCDFKKYEYEH